jgi:hypothetical protein
VGDCYWVRKFHEYVGNEENSEQEYAQNTPGNNDGRKS